MGSRLLAFLTIQYALSVLKDSKRILTALTWWVVVFWLFWPYNTLRFGSICQCFIVRGVSRELFDFFRGINVQSTCLEHVRPHNYFFVCRLQERITEVLSSMRVCAGSPENLLFVYAIITLFSRPFHMSFPVLITLTCILQLQPLKNRCQQQQLLLLHWVCVIVYS